MTILYHPSFPEDIAHHARDYTAVSVALGARFRGKVDSEIASVIRNPTAAGHFVQTGSIVARHIRRRNLPVFPFFILYGLDADRLIFASVIPSASDPVRWMERLR